ncbi:Leucine rich repeat containing 42 [Mactra antiquata]
MKSQCYNQPISLFKQCINLVADHLDLVESFYGLPSLIGEKIFHISYKTDRFIKDVQYSTLAVKLFTEAYGEEFLSKLNVSGDHLGLNYCLEQILLFTELTQLDVSECGLGDDHEIISQFQHLHKLEIFSLQDNVISNYGIQKMTAPYRMFTRGPVRLKHIDLSGNVDTSEQSLKYLEKFLCLKTVIYTCKETSIQCRKHRCWTLTKKDFYTPFVSTEGWAKVLIERWMEEASVKSRSVTCKPKPTSGLFSIKKPHNYQEIGKQPSSNCSNNDVGRSTCNIVAERIEKSCIDDDKSKVNIVQSNSTTEDDQSDLEQMLSLYKTVPDSNDTRTLLSNQSFDVLNGYNKSSTSLSPQHKNMRTKLILNQPKDHHNPKSRKKRKEILSNKLLVKTTPNLDQSRKTIIRNPFKFKQDSTTHKSNSDVLTYANTHHFCKTSEKISVDTSSTLISEVENTVRNNTRKRKKIVLKKKSSNIENTSLSSNEVLIVEVSPTNDLSSLEPNVKKRKLNTKTSILDSLDKFI